MRNQKTASSLALLLGGAFAVAVPVAASAAATTMYNLWHNNLVNGVATPCAPCAVGESDGWVWGFLTDSPGNPTAATPGWVGTAGPTTTPFGYVGGASLNWALHMTSNGTAEISNADSLKYPGVSADIDAAEGAWSDPGVTSKGGWRHDLDIGLFKSDVDAEVTLHAIGVNDTQSRYGFTVFKGMDASTFYNHHGVWNAFNNTQPGAPDNNSRLGGGTTFTVADIVAYSIGGDTPSNLDTISFHAVAGQVYTIVLGGYRNGSGHVTTDGYALTVTAVPVPPALWLMGSALAGLAARLRRRADAA
jgi:hypothetical protein